VEAQEVAAAPEAVDKEAVMGEMVKTLLLT
jgi:hypothetical protein